MDIIIDTRERGRVDRAKEHYTNKGHKVTVRKLDVGDYLFNDKVVFEYKRIDDFMNSIKNKSLFNEAANQSLQYPYHYVIIVGDLYDYLNSSWDYVKSSWDGGYEKYVVSNKFRFDGALRRLRSFTCTIECGTESVAFDEMLLQASKCCDGKSRYYTNVSRMVQSQDAVDVILCSAKNISIKKCRNIRDTYNVGSLEDLLSLSLEDFCNVKGIGESTSKSLYDFLHGGDC